MKKTLLGAMLAALLFNGCYLTTVESTDTGVEKSWGEVQKSPVAPGLAINTMIGTDLIPMRTANKVANFTGGADKEDSASELNNPAIVVLTEQKLPVPLDLSVMYQLKKESAPTMLATFGPDTVWDNMLITKEVRSSVRDAIGSVSLDKFNTQRDDFEKRITTLLNDKLAKYGVVVTNVAIRGVGIPQSIQDAVLAKETERENAEKAKYAVARAIEEAKIEVAKAEGIAKANQVVSASLTQQLVQYKQLDIQKIQAEKWNGAMPTTILGSNTTPLINLGK
jgi:regulator of protease activity HflC (stomatin/prohibitin superfamily)